MLLAFFSCQDNEDKVELSTETSFLVKSVTVHNATDNITSLKEYFYDSQNRLVKEVHSLGYNLTYEYGENTITQREYNNDEQVYINVYTLENNRIVYDNPQPVDFYRYYTYDDNDLLLFIKIDDNSILTYTWADNNISSQKYSFSTIFYFEYTSTPRKVNYDSILGISLGYQGNINKKLINKVTFEDSSPAIIITYELGRLIVISHNKDGKLERTYTLSY